MFRIAITLSLASLALLVVPVHALGQDQLQILVIGGEGSINNVKQRTAREPVVEIRDRNNRPVAGAIVLFEAPEQGASGTFINGARTLQVTTDAQGRAIGRGFRPNSIQGDVQMHVTASFQGATASTIIHMVNAGGGGAAKFAKAGHGKLIAVLAAVGAAAAVGIVAGTRGGGNTSGTTAPPVTISAGPGSVGPHP